VREQAGNVLLKAKGIGVSFGNDFENVVFVQVNLGKLGFDVFEIGFAHGHRHIFIGVENAFFIHLSCRSDKV
jgi:hypothetical protein